MPLDSEKKRLEAKLLNLLSLALRERNRDDIVGTSLELGALYLSGDMYDKSEECFRRVLEEPVADLARASEKVQAETGLAQVALRRGHLTLAREALARAEKNLSGDPAALLEIRQSQCELDLHAARYDDVLETIKDALKSESPEKLGDTKVDFMVLEARARDLLGRSRQALRLLEKALELAEHTMYEAGTANARSELGALLTATGDFKRALELLKLALGADERMGSQYRFDLDRRRLGLLYLRMGRWQDAEKVLQASYDSSRDLRTLEQRLGSQLAWALLLQRRGQLGDARDRAVDAMEVARAAGFVRRHVQGLQTIGSIDLERHEPNKAMEALREAEALYARAAPEGRLMLGIHTLIGQCHDALDQDRDAHERLIQAHKLAREMKNEYERCRIDSLLGRHFRLTGDHQKAKDVLTRSAADLGALGAKYDVALARLWYAEVLNMTRANGTAEEREKETRLARSNLFEARRLLEPMQAEARLAECVALEAELQSETPTRSND